MRDQDKAWMDEMMEVHSFMSIEISRRLENINKSFVLRRAQLKSLLNEIDSMDSLLDCKESSLKEYRLACQKFFSHLDELQLTSLMVEKIQKAFGADHFFLRVVPDFRKNAEM